MNSDPGRTPVARLYAPAGPPDHQKALENFPEPLTRGFYCVRHLTPILMFRPMLAAAPLELDHSREPANVHRLGVRGELDAETAPHLISGLRSARGPLTHLRLDLSAVTFIDCSGLRALLGALEEARGAGWVVEVDEQVSAPVRRIIQLTGTRRQIWP